MTTICRVCRDAFDWAITPRGRRMPVNPGQDPAGNLAVWRDGAGVLRCRVVSAAQPLAPPEKPGMPHAATCTPPPGVTDIRQYRRTKRMAGR